MGTDPQEALVGVGKYKLKPPTSNGDCGTFKEWKFKLRRQAKLRPEQDCGRGDGGWHAAFFNRPAPRVGALRRGISVSQRTS